MSEVRWDGKTASQRGGECRIDSPMSEGACVRDGTHWHKAFMLRERRKPMDAQDRESPCCVPYRLRCHGTYDLAGRVAASFCLDSLLTVRFGVLFQLAYF